MDHAAAPHVKERYMARMIFVNLPVKDLNRSMEFFRGLGFEFNEQFTNDEAAFMIVNDQAAVMLVSEPFFKTFSNKEIADTATHYEVSNAVSLSSKAEVDEIGEKALATGGSVSKPPSDDGFIYSRSFLDPDGHLWDVHWMDPAAING
jgi:predicted lactoylglutathione lyase